MTASVRQENQVFNSVSTAASSIAVALSNTLAGSAIHVLAHVNSTATFSGISDTQGNTYTALGADVINTVSSRRHRQYVATNIIGGVAANTITITLNFAITSGAALVKEIGGVSSAATDGNAGAFQATPGTGTDAVSSGTATNAAQPALISAFCLQSQNSSYIPAVSAGFTAGANGANSNVATYSNASKRITSSSAIAATYTAGSNLAHSTLMAIFDEPVQASPSQIFAGVSRVFVTDTIIQ